MEQFSGLSIPSSTDPFAVQLDGELRQIKEALRLVEVFLSFEDAAPTEDEEPVRDKFLTLVLQDKKSTFSRLLTGLVECVQAISACVNKGKLDKFSGIMRITDENLTRLTSVMIAVQELVRKEYDNVNTKKKQPWNFSLIFTLGLGASWAKLALFNTDNKEFTQSATNMNKPVPAASQPIAETTTHLLQYSSVANIKSSPAHQLTAPTQHSDTVQMAETSSEPGTGTSGVWNFLRYPWPTDRMPSQSLQTVAETISQNSPVTYTETSAGPTFPITGQLPTTHQHNDLILSAGAVSGSFFGTNGFLLGLLFNRWTLGIVATVATLYAYQSLHYSNLRRRAELLWRHQLAATRAVKELSSSCGYGEDGDKGRLEAFTIANLHQGYLFGAESRQIVLRDCAEIEITIQKIRKWIPNE